MFDWNSWDAELFFDVFAVEHVVYAEGYDSVIWGHVMNNAVVGAFYVKGVWVHEGHASD